MTNFFNQEHNGLWHWAGMFRPCLCLAGMLLLATACDTETIDFGSVDNVENVVSESDQIVAGTATYLAYSRSIVMDSVRANSHKCYFGSITDPETGADVKAEYACQLHCFEGEIFPVKDSLVTMMTDGVVSCDSVELLMFYDTWYGDRNTPLKVNVVPLDGNEDNMLPQGKAFYTNIDLSRHALKNSAGTDSIMATKTFSVLDRTLTDGELNDIYHTHCARIRLPKEYGSWIMQKYYDSPSSFKNTYTFSREVCPGFYLQLAGGDGAMLGVTSTSLNVYYRFHYKSMSDEGDKVLVDTIYNAYTNFVGTAEVIQATSFKESGLQTLIDDTKCTYVKSPAGIATEIELPVEEIFKGHEADSLARVQVAIMRYNSDTNGTLSSDMAFTPPSTLGMILKSEMRSFFEDGYELTSRKFATTGFTDNYNVYDFANIARLVSYMYENRNSGDPDWNKVVLMPVTVNTNMSSNTVVSVLNDMSITSARLVGGDTPIQVNVTYSRYK